MAQLLTLLTLFLHLAAFNPVVFASSKVLSERRDRAPYIEASEHSAQYLGGTFGGRLRKGSAYSKERTVAQSHSLTSGNREQEGTDLLVDKNIRKVFATNFGPGLYLFNNTAAYDIQPHSNSNSDSPNDQMSNDQPDLHASSSLPATNNTEFFKVQRSPDGKLSVVYNEDYAPQSGKDETNAASHNPNIGSNKGNRFETHFPNGLPLTKDKLATSMPTANHTRSKDGKIHFPTEEPNGVTGTKQPDISDCLEEDHSKSDKVFCSHLRNYPDNSHLENLIKRKFPNLELFFGEDLVLPQNISQRMNNAPNEEYLCRSRVRVIFPQSAQNKDYNWLYIVNSANYKQGIRVEECLDPGATCGENTGLSLANRFTATCEQGYIYRSLVAYANETIIKDTFRVPSCCKCVLRSY